MSRETAADIEQAKRNAALARARMQTTLGALKHRASPKVIAADAAQSVKAKAAALGDTARQRPTIAGAAVGAAVLLLFRKPVGRALKRLVSRRARLERREYQERLRTDRDRRRAEKDVRRAEKQARRDAARGETTNTAARDARA